MVVRLCKAFPPKGWEANERDERLVLCLSLLYLWLDRPEGEEADIEGGVGGWPGKTTLMT